MSDLIYCLRCKQKTPTNNTERVVTTNNRNLLKGTCSVCQTKKNKFIAGNGSGFFNEGIQKLRNLGVELHLYSDKGENVPNSSFNGLEKYSYAGPGTQYVQRVREGYQGINELDRMAKLHDRFYNENPDTKSRNISDIALAHRAREIASYPSTDEAQRKDAILVANLMENKARFGLGVKKVKGTKKSKN